MYDSLYPSVSMKTITLIVSMVFNSLPKLVVRMMDVEKQSNGADCGVLAIAYLFDICSGFDPCQVKFDHRFIRQHLVTCWIIASFNAFPCWVNGKVPELSSLNPWSFTVPVACLNNKVMKWPNVIPATFRITATAWTFPVRYLVSLKYLGNVKLVVTVFAKFSHLFMFLAWRCEYTCTFTCMCWMERAFALLSGCACAGWSEPLLCSLAVHVLDGGSLCSALRLWLCWME